MTAKKKATHHKEPAPSPDPPVNSPQPTHLSSNDVRGDNDAVLGHFVDVVSGEYEGKYGVFIEEANGGKTAVVRTRDNDSVEISTDVKNLRPAQAGRR